MSSKKKDDAALFKTPEAIRGLRRSLGLTQAAFALRLGVTHVTVSRWETGAFAPTNQSLIGLEELANKTQNARRPEDSPTEKDCRAAWDAWQRLDGAIATLLGSRMKDVSACVAEVVDARRAMSVALAKVAPTTIPHMVDFLARRTIGGGR